MATIRLFFLSAAGLIAGCSPPPTANVTPTPPPLSKPSAITLNIEVDLKSDQANFTIWNGTDEFVVVENRRMSYAVFFNGPNGRQSATINMHALREMPSSLEDLLIIPARAQITYPVPFDESTREMRKPGMEFYAEITPVTTDFWQPELAKAAKGNEKNLLKTRLVSPKVIAK